MDEFAYDSNLQYIYRLSVGRVQNSLDTLESIHDRTLSLYGSVRSRTANLLWRKVVVQTFAVFASDVLSVPIGRDGFTYLVQS